ncbi:MAG: protein-L-isoaspartate O-methyltransferase [Rhodocyclaceae bacterium]|nr:protein-L-isoaspartate O-methyltransferase [Rhodocyclaceae bacterium]
MNHELARRHMIEQQLRPWEVLDPAVVATLYADRREDFAPSGQKTFAFADIALPLGVADAVMLPPKLEAHCLQALELKPGERVLEIGTGSGHMAALLAARAQEVWSVEIEPALAEQARANLRHAGVSHVHVEIGDGLNGLPDHAPFDAIMVSGGVIEVPTALTDQLAVGGRLLAFLAPPDRAPVMTLSRITRVRADALVREDLLETSVPLLRQPPRRRFVF